MILTILCIIVHENDRLDKRSKRLYYELYFIVALSALFEYLGLYFSGNTNYPSWVLRVVKCGDYILTPFAGMAVLIQLRRERYFNIIVFSILTVNTLLQLVTAFTGGMITIDSHNRYSDGPLYPIYMFIYLTLIIISTIGFISYGRRFRRQNKLSLYAIMILILIGVLIQEYSHPKVRTAYLAIAIGLSLIYIHIAELAQTKKDDELRKKDYQILTSQAKPHFLFNSLAVIREIYQNDLETGDKALTSFSQYLRYNLDALHKKRMIDFDKEIGHIKRYLELQQLRFGDALEVKYDFQCTDFKVPILSIQPIVENAVVYGARKNKDGKGLITIRTMELDNYYEIDIIDNGPGFVPEDVPKRKDRIHIGIENVIERFKYTNSGKISIDSVLNEGTTFRFLINKKGKQE